MFVSDIIEKKAVVVRYKDVTIIDRREPNSEWACRTENLYDIMLDAWDTKDVPLSKDPVWKGLTEKINKLGYDICDPQEIVRIPVTFNVDDLFYWKFQRFDEEQAKAEQDGVLCLPS